MLEGPIFNQTTKTYENIDGKEILRIFKVGELDSCGSRGEGGRQLSGWDRSNQTSANRQSIGPSPTYA